MLSKVAPMLPLIQSKEVGSEFVGYLLKKSELFYILIVFLNDVL